MKISAIRSYVTPRAPCVIAVPVPRYQVAARYLQWQANRLGEGVEQLLLVAVIQRGFAQYLPCEHATFAALAGHPQCVSHILERVGTLLDRLANLGVGDTFAETNVHLSQSVMSLGSPNINRNENDCQ